MKVRLRVRVRVRVVACVVLWHGVVSVEIIQRLNLHGLRSELRARMEITLGKIRLACK